MNQEAMGECVLSTGARWLVGYAVKISKRTSLAEGFHNKMGLNHWLLGLIELFGPMAEMMAEDLDPTVLRTHLERELRQGNPGCLLDIDEIVHKAGDISSQLGEKEITERDLAVVILKTAGYRLSKTLKRVESKGKKPPTPENGAPGKREAEYVLERADESPGNLFNIFGPKSKKKTEIKSPFDSFNEEPQINDNKNDSILKKLGRNLTAEAKKGKLPPVVGREEEIQLIIETLCRRTKRNPVLVGPAGTGKTAIVEGLAQRIAGGQVPAVLAGVQIYELQSSLLVADTLYYGVLEQRMKQLIKEASRKDIILFIDEVHSIMGAGGKAGTADIASSLKPALARGDLACIAATTDEEYRRFIEQDAALERRFQPVRVQELTAEQTLIVLYSQRDSLERLRGVHVPDAVLTWLVSFARQFMRNRYFPDKAVDLLEQCVAYGVLNRKIVTDQESAAAVAQRMLGMPVDLDDRLSGLKEEIARLALLPESDLNALHSRLNVTMRGLDLRPARPNLMILLTGEAAGNKDRLAQSLARNLFGSPDRVVAIDCSRMQHRVDVSMLIGAPPGYIGYQESTPLHKLLQAPFSVLCFEHIHACHKQVFELLVKMLADGVLDDARGRRIYLSDTVVLLTAEIKLDSQNRLGFKIADAEREVDVRRAVEKELGKKLAGQVDIISWRTASTEEAQRSWLRQNILRELALRFEKAGIKLCFDESLVDWLLVNRCQEIRDWERLVEERVSLALIPYLPAAAGEIKTVILKHGENGVEVEVMDRLTNGV